jgi:hypothetical protein
MRCPGQFGKGLPNALRKTFEDGRTGGCHRDNVDGQRESAAKSWINRDIHTDIIVIGVPKALKVRLSWSTGP